MNLLALDLGTRTGWALDAPAVKARESGVQVFDVKRGESPGMRYVRFNRWLDEVARRGPYGHPVDLIVYEQTHHRGGAATEVAAGFSTRVQEFCASMSIEHAPVHSATLKKFTTGKGNADKDAMKSGAKERGWLNRLFYIPDDNEVDAICLLHYALAEIVTP